MIKVVNVLPFITRAVSIAGSPFPLFLAILFANIMLTLLTYKMYRRCSGCKYDYFILFNSCVDVLLCITFYTERGFLMYIHIYIHTYADL